MPLFDAVYWIASEGHTKEDNVSDWDKATRVIVAALEEGHLPAFGVLSPRDAPKKIPSPHWRGVVIDRLTMEPYLSLIGPANHPGSRKFQDELFMDGHLHPKWLQLTVKQGDIRRLWPFNIEVADTCGEKIGLGEKQAETEATAAASPMPPPAAPPENPQGAAPLNSKHKTARRRGRPPHDWDGTIEPRVWEWMGYHGDFTPQDPEWNVQARLEDKIIDEFGIGRTQLREKLPGMLTRWRSKVGK